MNSLPINIGMLFGNGDLGFGIWDLVFGNCDLAFKIWISFINHNHQPSTINHQPSTINHQPETINNQKFHY